MNRKVRSRTEQEEEDVSRHASKFMAIADCPERRADTNFYRAQDYVGLLHSRLNWINVMGIDTFRPVQSNNEGESEMPAGGTGEFFFHRTDQTGPKIGCFHAAAHVIRLYSPSLGNRSVKTDFH